MTALKAYALLNNDQRRMYDIAKMLAQKYGESNPDAFARQMQQESQFNPKALSHAGAYGLAQFMPGTLARFGLKPKDMEDPYTAFDAALKYRAAIRKYYSKNGVDATEANVLAGYNAGEGNVAKYHGVPPFKETRGYVANILNGASGNDTQLNYPIPPIPENMSLNVSQTPYKFDNVYEPIKQAAIPSDIASFARNLMNSVLGGIYGGKSD